MKYLWRRIRLRAGQLWVLPITAFGMFVVIISGALHAGRISRLNHTTGKSISASCYVAPLGGWLYRWFRNNSFAAVTIGEVILFAHKDLVSNSLILTHEFMHVEQAQKWGWVWGIAYYGACLWALITTGQGYFNCVFEKEARDAERPAPVLIVQENNP